MINYLIWLDHKIFEWIQLNLRASELDVLISLCRDKHFWLPLYVFLVAYVVFNYKKLAESLVEIRENALGSRDVIIGVGINFNLSKSLYRDVSSHICDLFDISGTIFDRNLIFGSLISELVGMLYSFEEHGFAYFKDEWIGYHAFEGKHACLLLPDNSVIEGIIDGVSDDGALSLVTSRGREFYKVGDISLRLS